MLKQKRDFRKILLVEGNDDKHSVIGLMKHHTSWPEDRNLWPVWVEVGNSVSELLAEGYLTSELKAKNVEIVGLMLDADINSEGRYQRIHQLCKGLFPEIPEQLPSDGLVIENEEKKRFGVWIMPNNQIAGDLETFLRSLVPDEQERIWKLACESVLNARYAGAKCRDVHVPKANLYTWLAWQDSPGQAPGVALTQKLLDPQSEAAKPFVSWFKMLYNV